MPVLFEGSRSGISTFGQDAGSTTGLGRQAPPEHHRDVDARNVKKPLKSDTRTRDERLHIRRWRRDQFMEIGFSASDAATLAKSDADLHETRRLLAAGCTHATAFRIVR
jgi:hypothetical protein